jgi:hypothetical protein
LLGAPRAVGFSDGGKSSPVIDIMGDASKGILPKASTTSSSFDASSSGASSVAEAEAEDFMDPHELVPSYEFEASLVMVCRIRQMEPLGYFAKVLARESGRRLCQSQM